VSGAIVRVVLYASTGMSIPLGEDLDLNGARRIAAKRIKYSRRVGRECYKDKAKLDEIARWWIGERLDDAIVDDSSGILCIEPEEGIDFCRECRTLEGCPVHDIDLERFNRMDWLELDIYNAEYEANHE
jgi:hypothetical protein